MEDDPLTRPIIGIKERFTRLFTEIRTELPLFEYILWWILRLILLMGGIWCIFKNPDRTFEMFISVALSFCIPILHLLFTNLWPGRVPIRLQTVGTIYLIVTSFCGTLLNFYYLFPWWDIVLHTFGGAILVYVGYCIMVALNAKHHSRYGDPSPIVQASWGVGFSAFATLVWEILEFTFDSVTLGDSQHWRVNPDPRFEIFKTVTDPAQIDLFHLDFGRYALLDTMTDIICGLSGAVVGFIVVLAWLHRQERRGRLQHGCAPEQDAECNESVVQADSPAEQPEVDRCSPGTSSTGHAEDERKG